MFQVEKTNPEPQYHNWLVQTWPTGYCYPRTDCNLLSEFTIHGLWPVDSYGNGLTNPIHPPMNKDDICAMIQHHSQTDHFSANMVRYWPSLMFKFNADLWVNEWNEHGRFQNSLVPAAYFINTIQVAQYVDMRTTLAEENIVPSTP
ncbi:hypothetical protein LWI29_013405 [Acer saccharum]|uniref:Uncharacterized protein n=1 Tax=Acer saccharum TaxID=4024 RepID=A0AA39T4Q0_ACESA|nr:hypothetical protein LWI29_013405 [Acer saccharum]